MLGQLIHSGTGMCDILLDEQKLIESLENINQTAEDFSKYSNTISYEILTSVSNRIKRVYIS